MTEKTNAVAGWAILLPNGRPLATLVSSTRSGAIQALGKSLWVRAQKNGYRVERVWITPWKQPHDR